MVKAHFQAQTSRKRRWPSQAGATLYEILGLLVILSVVAVIVGVLLLQEYKRAVRKSRVGVTRTQTCMLTKAVLYYKDHFKKLPDNKEGLEILVKTKIWNRAVPKDVWGRKYRYHHNKKGGFDVYSLGSDGKPGGTGLAADVYCRPDS